MRQVEYVGFGWKKVLLDDHHVSVRDYSFKLKKEVASWLRKYKSGGYYHIQHPQEEFNYPALIYFSKAQDAMMFKLMWG